MRLASIYAFLTVAFVFTAAVRVNNNLAVTPSGFASLVSEIKKGHPLHFISQSTEEHVISGTQLFGGHHTFSKTLEPGQTVTFRDQGNSDFAVYAFSDPTDAFQRPTMAKKTTQAQEKTQQRYEEKVSTTALVIINTETSSQPCFSNSKLDNTSPVHYTIDINDQYGFSSPYYTTGGTDQIIQLTFRNTGEETLFLSSMYTYGNEVSFELMVDGGTSETVTLDCYGPIFVAITNQKSNQGFLQVALVMAGAEKTAELPEDVTAPVLRRTNKVNAHKESKPTQTNYSSILLASLGALGAVVVLVPTVLIAKRKLRPSSEREMLIATFNRRYG